MIQSATYPEKILGVFIDFGRIFMHFKAFMTGMNSFLGFEPGKSPKCTHEYDVKNRNRLLWYKRELMLCVMYAGKEGPSKWMMERIKWSMYRVEDGRNDAIRLLKIQPQRMRSECYSWTESATDRPTDISGLLFTSSPTRPRTGKTNPSLPFLRKAACMFTYVRVCVLVCVHMCVCVLWRCCVFATETSRHT